MPGKPAKVLHVLGLLAKKEATYGAGITLSTATDGVLLQYADKNVGAPVELNYAFNGEMGPSVASLAQTPLVAPSGRSLQGDLPMRFRGPGATYSATVVPSIHLFLEASGFTASLTSGAYTYVPTAPGTSYDSLALEMYTRGEKWPAEGVLANLAFSFDNPQPPIFTFKVRGVNTTLPTDVAAPSITYPTLPITPLSSAITFTLGSFTAGVVYSGSGDLQRDIEAARVALTAGGGHLGFVPGMRKPMIKVVLEQTAFTTASPWHAAASFNPYQLREAATQLGMQLKFAAGTTVGGSLSFLSSQAQIMDVKPGNNGPIATVELTLQLTESAPGAGDDIRIVAHA